MQKAVKAKFKAGLKSSAMVRELDVRCVRGHCLSHNTSSKVQTQGSSHKDSPRSEKLKPKDLKPAPSCDDAAEPAKKEDRNKKKKKLQSQRREHTGEQTPAIGINTEVLKKKIKARCFNCIKKSQYANEYTKPPKNKCRSRQPPCRWLIISVRKFCSKEYLVSIIQFNSKKTKEKKIRSR